MGERATDFGAEPAHAETSPGERSSVTPYLGVILVVIGFAAWALYALASGSERHSYTSGVAPTYVHLTAGHNYRVAIRGGVRAERDLGIDPGELSCTARRPDGRSTALVIAAEDANSKATDQVGSFVARKSGRVHVDCVGLPAVFIDNADDADGDLSGFWLVLASAALAIGVPLTLSVLRRPTKYPDDPTT